MSSLAGAEERDTNKLVELCEVLGRHPLAVLAPAYTPDGKSADKLIARLKQELDLVLKGAAVRGQ